MYLHDLKGHVCIQQSSMILPCENTYVCVFFVFVHMRTDTCVCVCVSPGCLEEVGSRVSRQHRGSRPPAAHQTAAGRLLPAVFQHGGELCMTAESGELNSCTRPCTYTVSRFTPEALLVTSCGLSQTLYRTLWVWVSGMKLSEWMQKTFICKCTLNAMNVYSTFQQSYQ